ncbi:MAG TPA: ABC transporter ATP-binding protein [Rectinemataceae bacterium]|nr:ABC transporter ATP-binding protein [Rectinemataceae bacterium]
MSVNIKIKNAVKRYGKTTIISNLSLEIREGEFFTLLGPSGCGKTTLLRMIAGFNTIEGGDFFFNDTRINDIDPAKRNIGMVFQNYAIFPHLSVKQNVAFGLKNRKYPSDKIETETRKFLELMKIDQFKDRMPNMLSGGQQQRVALARALVIQPDVLLMDEPLSNLDAKLRVEMRFAIKEIQNRVGITTVYVTHDQEEAMAISDRIAVMKDGVIQHIGKPKDIYQRPANLFVSTFIGRTNLLEAELVSEGQDAAVKFPGNFRVALNNVNETFRKNQKVIVSIRPEEFVISTQPNDGMKAVVDSSVFLGLNTHYFVHLESGQQVEIIQESKIDEIISEKSEIYLTIKPEKINAFTENGSENILDGVNNDTITNEEA